MAISNLLDRLSSLEVDSKAFEGLILLADVVTVKTVPAIDHCVLSFDPCSGDLGSIIRCNNFLIVKFDPALISDLGYKFDFKLEQGSVVDHVD